MFGIGWCGSLEPVFGQSASHDGLARQGLIAFPLSSTDGQQIVVVDPRTRTLGIYRVDRDSGVIALQSVRQIHWDLQITGYNTADPSLEAVRSMLEQR